MNPKVTVAILAYYGQYIEECVKSVLAQTYKNIKVIVYDDCSPENIGEIVSKFDDPRLRYVRNEKNLREGGNFDQALDLCDTEYIIVFHGDDLMLPWMIEHELEEMEKNDDVGVVVASKFHFLDSSQGGFRQAVDTRADGDSLQNLIPMPDVRDVKYYGRMELIKKSVETGPLIVLHDSAMYRKSVIDRFPIRMKCEGDWRYWFELNTLPLTICALDYPLSVYRRHESNVSNSIDIDECRRAFQSMEEFLAALELNCDMRNLRTTFAIRCIEFKIRYMQTQKWHDLGELLSLRKTLEEENGWLMSDDDLQDAIISGIWGDMQSYILHSWKKHFADKRDCKLVIYGIGKHTEAILDYFVSDHVVGLMDGTRADGTIYGKQLITIEEAVALGVDAIVIVAQSNHVRIIYNRIAVACVANSIDIYDIKGNIINFTAMVART